MLCFVLPTTLSSRAPLAAKASPGTLSERADPDATPFHSAYDHLGSTSLITGAHGQRLARLQYGPWGEELGGGHNRSRFTYTGHQRERRTGYYYSVWRYLDPRAARWTQEDPLRMLAPQRLSPGSNLFQYARGNPIRNLDVLGLEVIVKSAYFDRSTRGWVVARPTPSDVELISGFLEPVLRPDQFRIDRRGQISMPRGRRPCTVGGGSLYDLVHDARTFTVVTVDSPEAPEATYFARNLKGPYPGFKIREHGGGNHDLGTAVIDLSWNLGKGYSGPLDHILIHELLGHLYLWSKDDLDYTNHTRIDSIVADILAGR